MSDPQEFDEEREIAVETPVYPDAQETDEQRRAYALQCYTACGDAHSMDGTEFVRTLALIDAWLKAGTVPDQSRKTKPQLRTV